MQILKNPKITRIAITKARINLGALVKRVHLKNEYFILEKDGIPIAGLMDVDELEDYSDVHNIKTQKEITQISNEYKTGKIIDARKALDSIAKELRLKNNHSDEFSF